MPPFYIGSTSVEKVNAGYRGTVVSAKYKMVWNEELSNNPQLFETRIITKHTTREEALHKENYFHMKLGVVKNGLYVNQAVASGCFGMQSAEAIEKMKQSRLKSRDVAAKKISDKRNDPLWKATVGKEANRKLSETTTSPEWKATLGKQRKENRAKTVGTQEWKDTVGAKLSKKISDHMKDYWSTPEGQQDRARRSAKASKTKSDPVWQATVGVEANKTRGAAVSAAKSSPEWKAKNSRICPHCGRTIAINMFERYHNDNCKLNINRV